MTPRSPIFLGSFYIRWRNGGPANECQTDNESLELNCRRMRPLNVSNEFGYPGHVPRSVSAAVAQVNRYTLTRTNE
jgi:hypothetical protein